MLYFEDFPVGERRQFGTKSVTEDDVMHFARDFDPQPFHIDKAAAQASLYGGIIASGWHTCSIAMRLICDGFLNDSASLGSPGVDEIRWKKPVRPGDALTLFVTTMIAKPSTSKPDRGVLTNLTELVNGRGEVVMTMMAMTMIGRRPT